MTGSDVHVIVVSYNSAAHLPGFVESVRTAADAVSLRITVVDNASRDESVAVARALGVQCFRCDENRGYAGGINAGRHLDGDSSRALLVANPDVRFGASSVSMLFRQSIRHAAITVPRIVDAHGRVRPSLRREPTLRRAAGEALLGDHWPRRPGGLSIIVRDGERYRRAGWADWATGAALMIPAACDEAVGDWPEQYFLYSEETDYLHRARLAGFPVRYEPSASAFHAEGASGSGGALVGLDAINRVRYYRSRHSRLPSTVYAGLVLVELSLRARDPSHRQAAAAVRRWGLPGAATGHFPDGRLVYEQLRSRTQSSNGV